MRLKALLLGCLLAGASLASTPSPYGIFGGPIPSYLLPSGAPAGTIAFTSDQGMMVSNGTTWAVNTSTSSIPANTVLGSVAGGAPGALTNLPPAVGVNGIYSFLGDTTGATTVDSAFGSQLAVATSAGSCLALPPGVVTFGSPVAATNGINCIKGTGPGPSIIRAAYSNTGGSSGNALLFTINAVNNSVNIPDFVLDNVVLDGGMIGSGIPPNTAASGAVPASGYIAGTPAGGTDAPIATFTGSTSGTTLTITAIASGTLYANHTVFDTGGNLSGLGTPSVYTISNGGATLPLSAGAGCLPSCTLTLSSAPATTSSETMYTTNAIPLMAFIGTAGYTSQARVAQFGCRFQLKNSVVQNVARTFGNIQGCNDSEIANNKWNNVGAGGSNYKQTANLPFISWNAAATQFSPSSTVSSGTSAVNLTVNVETCGIYFLYTDLQAINPNFYPTIAEVTPNTYIQNNTVVQSIAFNGGASCTRTAGNPATITFNAGTGMTLTLSESTLGTINTTDKIKVYDFPATGNRLTDNVFRNFGSATNILDGQQGFICSRNFWFGNYGLGNVTGSSGGNSSCYLQGSQLPGNTHVIVADNYIYQITGNGIDTGGGTATEITGNTIIDSGRAGISVASNGSPTSENPLVMADGYTITGNTIKNSNFSTNIGYQTGTAVVNGSLTVNTGNQPYTSIAITSSTGTCAAGSYISATNFSGYPYPAAAANSAGIYASGWGAGPVILSTGLYATSSVIGATLYCNTRSPVPASAGNLDANLSIGMSPSSATGTVQNVSVDGNIFSDDQYAPLPTATLTTSASTSSGSVLPFSSTTGAVVGQAVYCLGAQPFSTVTAIVTNVSITLSAPIATTVASGASCYLYNPLPTIAYNVDASSSTTFRNVNIGPSNQMLGAPTTNFSATAAPLMIARNNQGNAIPYIQAQSAVPVGIPASSGSGIGNNGAITLSVALDKTYGPTNNNIPGIYLYFPSGTLNTTASAPGNAAGLYWCIMTSTAAGTCYANMYTSGTPVPYTSATATPLVSTGSTSFSQAGTAIPLLTVSIPGYALGLNGSLDMDLEALTTTTNTKTITLKYGSNQAMSGAYTASTVNPQMHVTITNGGTYTSQSTRGYLSSLSAAGAIAAVNSSVINTDSTAAQNAIISVTLGTPGTDYVVFQNYGFKVSPN